MGIDLKAYVFPPRQEVSAVDILRKVDSKLNTEKFQQKTGLVTTGFLNVVVNSGGSSWAVSDIIEFPYEYTERPIFTWGQEGTYSGDTSNSSPHSQTGVYYTMELPKALADYIEDEDYSTFSPAIFIPRIIHWYKKSPLTFSGCYLLVFQTNPMCTEIDGKTCRLHFRFEGAGYLP